ncbi:MAG: hypothetical protein M0P73_06265 [Syntrophobacterales bacterium]|jgi:hypothetical protein|nr:hypothetical protein [Syntrophobacterales bacterium]
MIFIDYLAYGEMVVALAGWALGLWGIITGQAAILQYLYFFAWYPYIVFLDGLLFRLRGESWLLNRPRDFLQMWLWSTTVWLVFEALNLILKNWGYAAVVPIWWVRWAGYALAFATVLPGVLLTAEVISALGAFKGVRGRSFTPWVWQPAALLLGVACLVLPLVFPRYAFPLVWGAFFFLLDPCSDLLGGPSLINSFMTGERRQHLNLLAAGLICGLWWESWNYFAITKWVYIFPVLNFGKVFEMPILGYLGFPPFALEAAVMYNFLKALDERVLTTPRRRRTFGLAQGVFWLVMFMAMDAWTVISYQ